MTHAAGTLYGVGVGPGDPELITLKAVKALAKADMVFAASSDKNDYSRALAIARPHLSPNAAVATLGFPMTRDPEALDRAWRDNAARVAQMLDQGLDAAFLTLGDPLLYSTFGYLLRALRKVAPEASVVVVPGVTSFQAAAAATQTVLAESGQNLCIISGVNALADLKDSLQASDRAVILKPYRKFAAIRETLRELGMVEHSLLATHVGWEDERIHTDLDQAPAAQPYFSLILAGKE